MSEGARARHRRERKPAAFLPLVVLGSLLAVVASVLAYRMMKAPEAATAPRIASPSVTSSAPTAAPETATATAPDTVGPCLESVRVADELVTAATPAVESWRDYVNTRTQVIRNEIDEARRSQQYQAAVASGKPAVAEFRTLEKSYAPIESACTGVEESDFPRAQRQDAKACLTRQRAVAAAVSVAVATVAEWEEQLERIDAVTESRLPRAEYDELWKAAWLRAPANIDRFFGRRSDQLAGKAENQRQPSALELVSRAPECRLLS